VSTKKEQKLYDHAWIMEGSGDYPRWYRYRCLKCGTFAQFHMSGGVEEQTKTTCTAEKANHSPASVARFEKSQEARRAKDNS